MKNTIISVIMPCLNSAKYINETIESVLAQTFGDFEFIIVDSGSTDGTIEIITRYITKDARVKLLTTSVKSMGHQYNMGIDNAKGKYICFVESDDYYETNALENLYTAIKTHKCDFVRANFSFFASVNGHMHFIEHKIFAQEHLQYYDKQFMLERYPSVIFRDVSMWNGIYDRQFIEKHNIRLNETPGAAFQDSGFVLQTSIFSQSTFYIDKSVYNYRQDNFNSSFFNKSIYKFAMNEYLFIRKHFRQVPDIVKAYIIRRFFGMFDSYIREAVFNEIIPVEQHFAIAEFSEFRSLINKDYNSISISAQSFSGMYPPKNFREFCEDIMEYLNNSHKRQKIYIDNYLKLISFLKSQEKLVICALGERGKQLYVFLSLCGIKNIDLFDNDSSKHGAEIFNRTVKGIGELRKKDNFFLISPSNPNIAIDLRNQLLATGVSAEAVLWFYMDIDSFLAFQLPVRLGFRRSE